MSGGSRLPSTTSSTVGLSVSSAVTMTAFVTPAVAVGAAELVIGSWLSLMWYTDDSV